LVASSPSAARVRASIGTNACEKDKAAELFKAAQPVIDSVADKKLFHKNKAARHKSRLAAKVKALATA
jgi:small subunit ribosomal protein S20